MGGRRRRGRDTVTGPITTPIVNTQLCVLEPNANLTPGFVRPLVATFPVVPPGYVWTGTISASVATPLTSGANSTNPAGSDTFNELLANMQFTLYRNNDPQWTWVGYSTLSNIQFYSNDTIIVVGRMPRSGVGSAIDGPATQFNVNITFTGYSTPETEIVHTVPFISTSVPSVMGGSSATPTGQLQVLWETDIITIGQTNLFQFPLGSTGQARIWGIWLTLTNANVNNNVMTAQVQTAGGGAAGVTLASVVTATVAPATANSDRIFVPYNAGYVLQPSDFPVIVNLTNGGTADVFRCSAGIIFSVEQWIGQG